MSSKYNLDLDEGYTANIWSSREKVLWEKNRLSFQHPQKLIAKAACLKRGIYIFFSRNEGEKFMIIFPFASKVFFFTKQITVLIVSMKYEKFTALLSEKSKPCVDSSQMKEEKNCVINFHGDKVSTFGRREIFLTQFSTSALEIRITFYKWTARAKKCCNEFI